MIKKLSKHGNSLALVIEKPILDLLKIDADTELEVTTDGERLIVLRSETGVRKLRSEEAAARIFNRYDEVLRKLAD